MALDIGPADVVQLLLCDGSSLLAASLDLPRYLGPATVASDGAPTTASTRSRTSGKPSMA